MLNTIKRIFKQKKTKPSDDFIRRIRSLVIGEGMLSDGNIALMDLAIANMPNEGSVLEIGSYGGLSTNVIIHLLKKHNKSNPFFNCDAWIYEGYTDHLGKPSETIDGRTDLLRTTYSVYMKNRFIDATKFLSANRLPHSFHQRSNVFLENWNNTITDCDLFGNTVRLGGPIGFAYIDGDHSYEGAWNDFSQVSKHLVKHGYILLDDSADHLNFGSAKMMAEIKKDKRFKIVASHPNYLLQKIE